MKHTLFFLIGLLFLLIAFFDWPLYTNFPELFEPIHQFIYEIGTTILYIAGILALCIALFTWLPTWISLLLFMALVYTGSLYLRDKNVSFKTDHEDFSLTVNKKTIFTPPPTAPIDMEKQPDRQP